jgi:hypothetical protein
MLEALKELPSRCCVFHKKIAALAHQDKALAEFRAERTSTTS